ncbi:class 1 fructose-bisphosphatase [Methylophilus aquaticus]|uniref:Fructose-1,6-bisphosphatase class 1 n=1 Tax=Methylophilus aquaticus TaxID=1971610 RepID=A0ABT9JTX4_9PROT|nr:class 1 fructose-bisphosphatase [Methylophilus aquaticus]MDP8567998.1 class 1 fructose-bisphosphatase [Methylophilus aquaticus]
MSMKLNEYLSQAGSPQALASLCLCLAEAGKAIATLIAQGALKGVTEKMHSTNVQGETQMQVDILSHELALAQMVLSGVVAGVLSEEVDLPVWLDAADAPFLVSMDPLDGSSNLAINGVVGSIFSVLPNLGASGDDAAFLQPGSAQLAAMYLMYGPATLLVLTVGKGTQVFTLASESGDFVLTQSDVQIAADTSEFAINASNQRYWQPAMQRYVDECLQGVDGPRGRDFNMRWCASMVMDVHRILSRGGVFLYPRDCKQPVRAGRLRLLYEANPMSLLVTQAGGGSINGEQDVLSLQPEQCHQRVPVLLGAKNEIERLREYHRQA